MIRACYSVVEIAFQSILRNSHLRTTAKGGTTCRFVVCFFELLSLWSVEFLFTESVNSSGQFKQLFGVLFFGCQFAQHFPAFFGFALHVGDLNVTNF